MKTIIIPEEAPENFINIGDVDTREHLIVAVVDNKIEAILCENDDEYWFTYYSSIYYEGTISYYSLEEALQSFKRNSPDVIFKVL